MDGVRERVGNPAEECIWRHPARASAPAPPSTKREAGCLDSSAAPEPASLPLASSFSDFHEMLEQGAAKYTPPLDSQLVHERRPSRALLATAGGITAAIGVPVIVALLFLNGFPKPKSNS